MRTTILSLLLAGATFAQGAPSPGATPTTPADEGWTTVTATEEALGGGWSTVDGIAAVAGDRVITQGRLVEFFDRHSGTARITTAEDYQRELGNALRALVTIELESQAGRDLGLEPEQVKRIVRESLKERKRESGAVAVSANLRERGHDPINALQREVDELYTHLWRLKTIGQEAMTGLRPSIDRYVRPGELREIFRVNRIGPAVVELQILDIRAADAGGVEPAREYIASLRQQVLDGAEFGVLILENGASYRRERGLTGLLQAEQIGYPALRDFAENGEIGSLSEVLEIVGADGKPGFLIARLLDRKRRVEERPFVDRTVQDELRTRFLGQRDELRLARARQNLLEQSYLWPEAPVETAVAEAP